MTTDDGSATAGTSQIAQSQPQPQAAASADWTAGLPPDLKAMVENKGYKSPVDLAAAYLHAQRAIGADKILLPKDGVWDPAARAKLGIPEKPDGYKIARPELPGGIAYDEHFERSMLPVAHRLGLTPAQVNGLVQAVTEHRLGEFDSSAQSRTAAQMQGEAALKAEYGAAYQVKVQQAARAAKRFGGDDLIAYLDETGLGNDPRMVRAWAKIGALLSEDTMKSGQGASFTLSPDEARAEYHKLMATDAYRRGDHTEHGDTVRKVQQLFEQAFPAA